ncbi:MAG: site-specific integrase [Paenibacillaceae bacterium]
MKEFLFQSKYFHVWNQHFNRSKNTKRKYIFALKRFEAFLQREGFEGELDFEKFHGSREYPDRYLPIQRKVIEGFVHYLKNEERVTDSLLSATVTGLKSFFGFLYDMDFIQHNPMQDIPTPKYERPIQNTALSLEECNDLLAAALRRDPFYRQEFVMVWFMLITGLRRSEVHFLKRSHLNLDTRIVRVSERQKTDPSPVAIPKNLTEELKRYVNHPNYLRGSEQGGEYLFHNINGGLMPFRWIPRTLRGLSQEAALSRFVRPHDLRRTTGYLMQQSGVNIFLVKNQLRQKDLATTLIYVPPLLDMAKILEDD